MGVSTDKEQKYRIGTVARLTGISADTLRVWERRYGVVEPVRAPGGGREYSRDDIERLQLVKQLVDAGDAIGSVAGLDTDALVARSTDRFTAVQPAGASSQEPCRIAVVGGSLPAIMEAGIESLDGLELLAAGSTVESCLRAQSDNNIDVLVIEIATVHADTTRQIIDWLEDIGASRALVVYRFAATDALQRLPAARIQTVRAPVTPLVVRNLCLGMRPRPAATGMRNEQEAGSLDVSPRRFSNQALSQLAMISPAMRCECPKHLAELITDLVAFERYSAECENRNTADAALHAYLHATASQAREMIEHALGHVIQVEGIELHG